MPFKGIGRFLEPPFFVCYKYIGYFYLIHEIKIIKNTAAYRI